ncbi:glutamic acid-rich protein-like [Chenopodium quinoa]|uniref:glutamic acid-rich protein-like n=1 Tax=Chenopodium quinoa TaxID=63459 RepID=UPI000B799215|nr:glutamic acid-rich protein-like [Chenopodium quinoa]
MSESVEGYIAGKAIVADPFMHLSSAPEKQAEKFSRCISTCFLEDVDIIGVESISVVSQSSSEIAINEYGTNFCKISINKLEMPRSKFPNISSDQAESSLRRPGKDPVEDPDTQESDIREEDIESVERSLESGREEDEEEVDGEEEQEGEEVEEEEEEEEEQELSLSSEDTDEEILKDINIGEQVTTEERVDEGYNSEDDDAIYRQPLQLSDTTKVV